VALKCVVTEPILGGDENPEEENAAQRDAREQIPDNAQTFQRHSDQHEYQTRKRSGGRRHRQCDKKNEKCTDSWMEDYQEHTANRGEKKQQYGTDDGRASPARQRPDPDEKLHNSLLQPTRLLLGRIDGQRLALAYEFKALPDGSRLSCGALMKDSFLNLRTPPASSAC